MLNDINIGLAITGSFCNFPRVKGLIEDLKNEKANVIPIVSDVANTYDTRFFVRDNFIEMVERETGNKVISSIVDAEPIGPKDMLDVLLIAPCTGNTIAKLANGITDSPVLMAAKSHQRNNKPIVIGVSTNDGLGSNFKNIGELYNTKNYYFVPFKQDNFKSKPKSLVLDYTKVVDTIKYALNGRQIGPLFV